MDSSFSIKTMLVGISLVAAAFLLGTGDAAAPGFWYESGPHKFNTGHLPTDKTLMGLFPSKFDGNHPNYSAYWPIDATLDRGVHAGLSCQSTGHFKNMVFYNLDTRSNFSVGGGASAGDDEDEDHARFVSVNFGNLSANSSGRYECRGGNASAPYLPYAGVTLDVHVVRPLKLSVPSAPVADYVGVNTISCDGLGYPDFTVEWTVGRWPAFSTQQAQRKAVGQGSNTSFIYAANSNLTFRGRQFASLQKLWFIATCTATYTKFNCTKALLTSADYNRCQSIPRTIVRHVNVSVVVKPEPSFWYESGPHKYNTGFLPRDKTLMSLFPSKFGGNHPNYSAYWPIGATLDGGLKAGLSCQSTGHFNKVFYNLDTQSNFSVGGGGVGASNDDDEDEDGGMHADHLRLAPVDFGHLSAKSSGRYECRGGNASAPYLPYAGVTLDVHVVRPLTLSVPSALVADYDTENNVSCQGLGYPQYSIQWTVQQHSSPAQLAQRRLVRQGSNASLVYFGKSELRFRGRDFVSRAGTAFTAVCTATYVDFNCTMALLTPADYSRCQNTPRTVQHRINVMVTRTTVPTTAPGPVRKAVTTAARSPALSEHQAGQSTVTAASTTQGLPESTTSDDDIDSANGERSFSVTTAVIFVVCALAAFAVCAFFVVYRMRHKTTKKPRAIVNFLRRESEDTIVGQSVSSELDIPGKRYIDLSELYGKSPRGPLWDQPMLDEEEVEAAYRGIARDGHNEPPTFITTTQIPGSLNAMSSPVVEQNLVAVGYAKEATANAEEYRVEVISGRNPYAATVQFGYRNAVTDGYPAFGGQSNWTDSLEEDPDFGGLGPERPNPWNDMPLQPDSDDAEKKMHTLNNHSLSIPVGKNTSHDALSSVSSNAALMGVDSSTSSEWVDDTDDTDEPPVIKGRTMSVTLSSHSSSSDPSRRSSSSYPSTFDSSRRSSTRTRAVDAPYSAITPSKPNGDMVGADSTTHDVQKPYLTATTAGMPNAGVYVENVFPVVDTGEYGSLETNAPSPHGRRMLMANTLERAAPVITFEVTDDSQYRHSITEPDEGTTPNRQRAQKTKVAVPVVDSPCFTTYAEEVFPEDYVEECSSAQTTAASSPGRRIIKTNAERASAVVAIEVVEDSPYGRIITKPDEDRVLRRQASSSIRRKHKADKSTAPGNTNSEPSKGGVLFDDSLGVATGEELHTVHL